MVTFDTQIKKARKNLHGTKTISTYTVLTSYHFQTYLWTHHHFNIHYNGDHVISANVTTKDHSPTNLNQLMGEDGQGSRTKDIRFTYSVQWIPTKMNEEDRERIMQSGKSVQKGMNSQSAMV